jgi:hypothetical protein
VCNVTEIYRLGDKRREIWAYQAHFREQFLFGPMQKYFLMAKQKQKEHFLQLLVTNVALTKVLVEIHEKQVVLVVERR